MIVIRVLAFAAGAVLIGYTLLSATKTVVLPRAETAFINRVAFRGLRRLFDFLAPDTRSYGFRDRVMALYGPVALLSLPVIWLSLVLVAYMPMLWALRQEGWSDAFLLSGSSLLTLGFAAVDGNWQLVLAFTEATLGLGLLALLITFLPSLYGAFSRRETEVALLEVRAGSPPSAVEFVTRFHRIGWLDGINREFERWERWFVEVEEAHTSYPALNFFRSPQPDRSWVVAAGTVLDTASLIASTVDLPHQSQTNMTIRAGFIALRRIAVFFGIPFDPDPRHDDPISITRAEFDAVCETLASEGVPLQADRDRAWRDFAGWRVNYDTVLLALAELTMAPIAPWTSDRSTPAHRPVRVRRWGSRLTRR